jgi:transcriptional regulator with XRE-family HTH domain
MSMRLRARYMVDSVVPRRSRLGEIIEYGLSAVPNPVRARKPSAEDPRMFKQVRGKDDPAVQRRLLLAQLKQARSQLKLTQSAVAAALDWSPSKLLRIENGDVKISTTDLKALVAHYGITDPGHVEELVRMAQIARKQKWASPYSDVLAKGYVSYLANVGSASVIRQFEPLLIPGLLQTPDYARGVIRALSEEAVDHEQIERRVQARMEHQERTLDADDPPAMRFVLDAATVRRNVGGAAGMSQQFERLKLLNARDNIRIQILSFSVGPHIGLAGTPFVLLEFPEGNGDYLLYLENSHFNDYVAREKIAETSSFLDIFDRLTRMASDPMDLHGILDRVLARMEEQEYGRRLGAS